MPSSRSRAAAGATPRTASPSGPTSRARSSRWPTEGLLDEHDARVLLEALAEGRDQPLEAARFEAHLTACANPLLIELPPLVACEIQLRLLVLLGVASEASLWRTDNGTLEPLLSIGVAAESRRARATARSALRAGAR